MSPVGAKLFDQLSVADLKRLAATKEKIENLEAKRDKMQGELKRLEAEIDKLYAAGAGKPTRKKRRKKAAKKRVAKRKVAKKKVAKKRGKKAARKAVAKKTAKKKVARRGKKKAGRKTGPTLESVIIDVIKGAGEPMPFPEIKAAIEKGKLFKSKSKNFDNVLRRTISTSKKIKRVGRGVYRAA